MTATWMVPPRHFVTEAPSGHGSDTSRGKAKEDEGSGQRLEANELGHEFLSAGQKSRGRKWRPEVQNIRRVEPCILSETRSERKERGRGLAGMQSHLVVFS